jgi:hypothetical protein
MWEPVDVYNVGGVVKSFSMLVHIFWAAPRTPLALRAESGVKGDPQSGALLEDP